MFVYILLHVCPNTAAYVCPHTAAYVCHHTTVYVCPHTRAERRHIGLMSVNSVATRDAPADVSDVPITALLRLY